MEEDQVKAFICEYDEHEGDRVVRSSFDQYLASVDIMSSDNKRRVARMHPFGGKGGLRLCEGCKNKLIQRTGRPGGLAGQGTLFEAPS